MSISDGRRGRCVRVVDPVLLRIRRLIGGRTMTITQGPGLFARVLELHRIHNPGLDDVELYLRDTEPEVRAAALQVLTGAVRQGNAPRGTGDTLAWALADEHEDVRRVAADALRGLPELYLGDDGVA